MQMDVTTFYNPSEAQDEMRYSSNCRVPINISVSSNIQVGVCYPSLCSPNEFALVLLRMNITLTCYLIVLHKLLLYS